MQYRNTLINRPLTKSADTTSASARRIPVKGIGMKTVSKKNERLKKASVLVMCMAVMGCGSSGDSSDNPATLAADPVSEIPVSIDPPVAVPGVTASTAIGEVLVFGEANRTMYTFGNDTDGVSNCTGECLATWPAVELVSEINQGQFSTLVRSDGLLQASFKDRPLYFFQGDAAEGEINGEGIGDVWFVARPDPIDTGETGLGTVLVGDGSVSASGVDATVRIDRSGLTLYTFRNDSIDTSVCNEDCAVTWPPLFADRNSQAADGFTLVTRADGTSQWALNGQALYFFQGDSAAGDTNGEGLGGVWDVARPPE